MHFNIHESRNQYIQEDTFDGWSFKVKISNEGKTEHDARLSRYDFDKITSGIKTSAFIRSSFTTHNKKAAR